MVSFSAVSGRSAVRLARLLREQEVAGSNPVAPTNHSMRECPYHSLLFVLILALHVLTVGCAPSPKYRGSPPSEERRAGYHTSSRRQAPTVGITFAAPLRNYHVSRITSRFGLRRDPRYNREEFHYGIDIKARAGEKVYAAAAGTVTFAGRQRGFGKLIIIDHGDRVSTVYGHLSTLSVKEGERIANDQIIGTVGRTGNATGIHLHFEIRKAGEALNPLDYL